MHQPVFNFMFYVSVEYHLNKVYIELIFLFLLSVGAEISENENLMENIKLPF